MAEKKDCLAVRLHGLAVGVRTIAPHPELGGLFAAPTLVVAAPLEVLKVWPVVADLVDVRAGRDVEGALARLAHSVRVGDFFARDGRVAVRDELARRRARGESDPWQAALANALFCAVGEQAGALLDLGQALKAARRQLRAELLPPSTRGPALWDAAGQTMGPEQVLLLEEQDGEATALLAQVLQACTPAEKNLLEAWRDDPDLPLAEVARRLGLAPGTARALLWRVRQKAGHL